MKEQNYAAINRASWNNKVDTHIQSAFYDVDGFLKGASSLNPIELALLGDIRGKSILHLQCHFGQDSLSLARLGAKVTGVDLSDKAIARAEEFTQKIGVDAEFICCNIYDLPKHLDKRFDIVFSSYGTIGWLPDLDQWASLISSYLKPGGSFVFVEFHPVVWMFDDSFQSIAYSYFNTGPIVETISGSYAEKNADMKQEYVMWNHSTSEVLNSLIKNGLQLQSFDEYDYSPYDCFSNTIEVSKKQYRIEHLEDKIPMIFALKATKNT